MKRLTNVQTVKRLMEFSRYGAMSQLVIMEAIRKYAESIESTPLEEMMEAWGENTFIVPEAWHGAASEIARKLRGEEPI